VMLWNQQGDFDKESRSPAEQRRLLDEAQEAIDRLLPGNSSQRVTALDPTGEETAWLYAEANPDTVCPESLSEDERETDPRCEKSGGVTMISATWPGALLVDDGAMIGAIGLPGADEAARALARGEIVVNSESSIWADGT